MYVHVKFICQNMYLKGDGIISSDVHMQFTDNVFITVAAIADIFTA